MRITHEQAQQIYEDMHPIAWEELGRLHVRAPLGLTLNGHATATLVHLKLAEPIGRQNLEHTITELGAAIWENHRPPSYHRRQR
ncbi:hypothetical protein LCGC14_0258260 [marine sediment metagenome]|uniref:Uncharacterized protein n=1 Tax=marine sediment metagenome TaxID=412755 RepID=A0A0F9WMP2_9ZZZZ